VIASDDQLVGGLEVEKILPHEVAGEPITAGERLELGLIPAPALSALSVNLPSLPAFAFSIALGPLLSRSQVQTLRQH